jgi:hypothetical protein
VKNSLKGLDFERGMPKQYPLRELGGFGPGLACFLALLDSGIA